MLCQAVKSLLLDSWLLAIVVFFCMMKQTFWSYFAIQCTQNCVKELAWSVTSKIIVIEFDLLDSINISAVNKSLKKHPEWKFCWTKRDIRNNLSTKWISSFHGWSLGYSDQCIWSLSSCPPLFCPINKISLSHLRLGPLWDSCIPDAGSSSRLHRQKRSTWIFFLPVNLIPGYTVICIKESSKRLLILTPQKSCLIMMEDAVLHIRYACHLD